MSVLQKNGVAAGVVRTAADAIEKDPQLRARGHWVYLDHPEMGRSLYNAPPFRISGLAVVPSTPAPLLGQHTCDVCRDLLGLSESEIGALQSEGVLT